jgi:hypothetical protein
MKDWIVKLISKLRTDYLLHYLVCYFMVTFLRKFFIWVSLSAGWALALAIVLTVAAMFFKEYIWDKKWGKGTWEWQDIAYGALGLTTGLLVILV